MTSATTAPMDLEQARFNMVEQQIRPWEVLDPEILELLMTLRREDFVPEVYRSVAFADLQIPLAPGARMWEPKVEARILQELALRKNDRVLEIGTGSGFLAALMAARATEVVSLEIDKGLAERARKSLARAGIVNVSVEVADGAKGWPAKAPYDAIVVTGAVPAVPAELLAQLKVGGRLAAIVGAAPLMEATLVTQTAEGVFSSFCIFETVVDPLKSVKPASAFAF